MTGLAGELVVREIEVEVIEGDLTSGEVDKEDVKILNRRIEEESAVYAKSQRKFLRIIGSNSIKDFKNNPEVIAIKKKMLES